MISDELKQVIEQIKDQGKMRFLEAATEEQIALFEKENDIKLPIHYKEWLQYSDGGELYLPAGVQLYGVAHKPLIDKDDNDRPDDNYIVVGALASGEPVLFKKDEEKFYIYDHESQELDDDLTYDDSAAIPRIYRNKFHRDIYKDLHDLQKSIDENDPENSALDSFSLELFEDISYIMAKHADPQGVPDTPDEWLDQFGTFSIYQVLPEIIELWGAECADAGGE